MSASVRYASSRSPASPVAASAPGGESLSRGVEVSRGQEGAGSRDGRVETGSGSGAACRVEGGLDIPGCRAGLRFGHGEQVVEPGRRCPAIPATLNQVRGGRPVGLGQGAARGHQAGDRADQPVGISSQGGVGLLQPAAGGVQLVALQVHESEGDRC